jgi:hypothetical protein
MFQRTTETKESKTVSVIIPALNEAEAIQDVIKSIPQSGLAALGYQSQILVVDNGSTDGTGELARQVGAETVYEPRRGYGRAYKTGLARARGQILVTCDADLTYPTEMIPDLVRLLVEEDLDFITTNRFHDMVPGAMSARNRVGNAVLNLALRLLYGIRIADSQSGMWVLKKELVSKLRLISDQMPFSEELKIECIFYERCRWREVPITYRERVGPEKLHGWRDGFHNLIWMFRKRFVR